MGSKFMTVYACDIERVRRWLGSHDGTSAVEELTADAAAPLTGPESQALRAIVERSHLREPEALESEDGHLFIRAFERVCRHLCPSPVGVEMYDDEDETPLLWRFVWQGDDPFELPTSSFGTPVVGWHDPDRVATYLAEFSRLRTSGSNNEAFLADEDLDVLVDALAAARARGTGVFVFRDD